jgi:hypothetical protein
MAAVACAPECCAGAYACPCWKPLARTSSRRDPGMLPDDVHHQVLGSKGIPASRELVSVAQKLHAWGKRHANDRGKRIAALDATSLPAVHTWDETQPGKERGDHRLVRSFSATVPSSRTEVLPLFHKAYIACSSTVRCLVQHLPRHMLRCVRG